MTSRMVRTAVACLFVIAVCVTAFGQMDYGYLDVYTVKVKPEKRAQFDELAKKFAEANRSPNGDKWLTMETMYGDADVISFVSARKNYGEVEDAMKKFMGSLEKAWGAAGMQKVFDEWASCVEWSRGELRARRWDLSSNVPKDVDAYMKMVGHGRFVRTTMVKVRPGRIAEFEATVKEVKALREKNTPNEVVLVSQAVAGQEGTVFYVTSIQPNMAGFDSLTPNPKLLGPEGYQKWLKTNSEIIETTRTAIMRYNGAASAAPPEVAAVSPEFWTPKPVVAKKAAPKAKKPTEGQ